MKPGDISLLQIKSAGPFILRSSPRRSAQCGPNREGHPVKIRSSVIPAATATFARVTLRNLVLAAAAAVFALGSASAFAWSQRGTAYTSHGTYNGAHYGSCGGGSCSHAGGVAGPYGALATNSATVTRTGTGQFSNSGTAT